MKQTKTFSGRADANKLEYADVVCHQQLGMSFGKFCSGELVDYIYENGTLPELQTSPQPNDAIVKMQTLISRCSLEKRTGFGELVGNMTDDELSDLSRLRFEE